MLVEQHVLTQLGLSPIEAKLYVELIGRGPLTIFALAQDSQIARTTVYKAVTALMRRGLLSGTKRNKVLHVEAVSPEVLLDVARNQVDLVQGILPKLLVRSKDRADAPNVKFFSGNRGVRAAVDEMYDRLERLRSKKLYTISHPEFLEYYPRFLPNIIKRKEHLRIHTSLIAPFIAARKTPLHYQNNQFRETRFMPKEFPFHSTMIISDVQTLFLSFRDERIYAMAIESNTLSEMFKQIFLFIWQGLPRI